MRSCTIRTERIGSNHTTNRSVIARKGGYCIEVEDQYSNQAGYFQNHFFSLTPRQAVRLGHALMQMGDELEK